VAVADHRHFGRAAEAVRVSQPGLSSQIADLEQRLGVVLFERTSRRVTVTPAGQEIVDRARSILREIGDLAMVAGLHERELRGPLSVGAIPTMAPYLFPALVRTVRHLWPAVELRLEELQTGRLVAAVESGALDLGLLATPVETGGLHVEEVTDEQFYLVCPETHVLAEGDGPVPVSALADLPVLLLEEGHCLRHHALSVCDRAGAMHAEVGSAGLSTLTQMVAAGLGVTLIPESALPVEARSGSGVSVRPFEDPAPGRGVALVWRAQDPRAGHYPGAVRVLRDHLAGALR
jgi:LysR family hydrogen peroxide-inducible transcriptional activator